MLGQRQITVDYVSRGPGGLDYTRTLTVVSAPPLAPTASTGTFYHLGSRGEVRFRYGISSTQPQEANLCFDVGDESVRSIMGSPTSASNRAPSSRGSWDGRIELLLLTTAAIRLNKCR